VIGLLLTLALANYRPSPITPGVARELTKAQVCGTKWGLDKRHVTLAMKQHVAAAYGIPWSQHSKYEFDHLIPRELGGADSESNLWPQPWTGPYNAHQKDRLENALHKAVCAGQMTLDFAQDAISSDWVAAYRLYVEAKH
jgi:hypothetical protein